VWYLKALVDGNLLTTQWKTEKKKNRTEHQKVQNSLEKITMQTNSLARVTIVTMQRNSECSNTVHIACKAFMSFVRTLNPRELQMLKITLRKDNIET
jgi:hypothetical protein